MESMQWVIDYHHHRMNHHLYYHLNDRIYRFFQEEEHRRLIHHQMNRNQQIDLVGMKKEYLIQHKQFQDVKINFVYPMKNKYLMFYWYKNLNYYY
jgi:hypothetical protein